MTLSRYQNAGTGTVTSATGDAIPYLRRRFLPAIDPTISTRSHTVSPGEVNRPDLVAAAELHDAELSWQLADTNPVLRPSELCKRQGDFIDVPITAGLIVGRSDAQ